MNNTVNPILGTLILLMAFIIAFDVAAHLLFGHTSLMGEYTGLFAFVFVFALGQLAFKVYRSELLKAWLLSIVAWGPVVVLCAVLGEVLFYDTSFPVGGSIARYAAKWLSTRLTSSISIGVILASAITYSWLMLNVYARDNDFFSLYSNENK